MRGLKRVKRAAAVLPAAALLLSLWGCDTFGIDFGAVAPSPSPSAAPASAVSVPEEEPQTLSPYAAGLLQYAGDPAEEQAREAFLARIEEWGLPEDLLTVRAENAGGSPGQAEQLGKTFLREETDLIVTLSAPARDAAEKALEGSAALLYVEAGGPEGGTGVEMVSPEAAAVALARELKPELTVLGLLTVNGDELLDEELRLLRAACAEQGIPLREAIVPKSGSAAEVARSLCQEGVEVVYTPAGGLETAAAEEAARVFVEEKRLWLAGSAELVQAGALLSQTPDYAAAGREAADLTVQLMAGRAPEELSLRTLPADRVCINETTLNGLKAELPQRLLETASYYSSQTEEGTGEE